MWKTACLSLAVVFTLAACGKGTPPIAEQKGCERYASMEVTCGDTKGEEVRSMAKAFCEGAEKDSGNLMSKMILLERDCAQTTTECAPYKACIDKAKVESP